jgi:hypothetical protein
MPPNKSRGEPRDKLAENYLAALKLVAHLATM